MRPGLAARGQTGWRGERLESDPFVAVATAARPSVARAVHKALACRSASLTRPARQGCKWSRTRPVGGFERNCLQQALAESPPEARGNFGGQKMETGKKGSPAGLGRGRFGGGSDWDTAREGKQMDLTRHWSRRGSVGHRQMLPMATPSTVGSAERFARFEEMDVCQRGRVLFRRSTAAKAKGSSSRLSELMMSLPIPMVVATIFLLSVSSGATGK